MTPVGEKSQIMPHYLHSKLEEPERGTPYDTPAEAHTANDSPDTHKVSFVPTPEDKAFWRQRETDRFMNGTYLQVPWTSVDRFSLEHFVHLSVSHAGLVAYTRNEEHGIADRQTRVKPGRYLEEFYSDVSQATRARWIGECGASHTTLKIARSTSDIVRVYVGGPNSCMSGAPDDYDSPVHPCSVYGESDLGVAYIGDIDKAAARSIVWPDRHVYLSKPYGNVAVLHALLETAGYTAGSLRGAKVRRIDCDNDGVVMPYVDGIQRASESGKWIVLDNRGPIETHHTNGVSVEEHLSTCSNCGDSYAENEDTDPYCQSCYEDSYCCIDCEETYFSDGTSTDNGMLCEHCYRERLKTCAAPHCDREWLEEEEFSRTERRERRDNGTDVLCRRCQNHHAVCDDCSEWYDTGEHDACPDCTTPDEDESSEDESPDTPAPAPAPFLYMRHVGTEFVGEVAYLKYHTDTSTLWQVNKDGAVTRVTNNWISDWRIHLASGAWEPFTPTDGQMPIAANVPIMAHVPVLADMDVAS